MPSRPRVAKLRIEPIDGLDFVAERERPARAVSSQGVPSSVRPMKAMRALPTCGCGRAGTPASPVLSSMTLGPGYSNSAALERGAVGAVVHRVQPRLHAPQLAMPSSNS